VTTLWARRHVIRPIQIFCALAIGGAVAAVLAFTGVPVSRFFLAMTTCLALAFSVNRRVTSRSIHPTMGRALWILAAALMLAAMQVHSTPDYGSGGIGAVSLGVAEAIVESLPVVLLLVYVGRGILADRGDRLLIGALAGILSIPVAAIITFIVSPMSLPESSSIVWGYPFWLLLGAALARANGNLRRP
jgi:hypothetical protein